MSNLHHYDTLIIGSGLAGVTVALELAEHKKIAILTKGELLSGSSNWAQGGISAVMDSEDTLESHYQDTLIAGANLNDPAATRAVINGAPEAINWLLSFDVPFTREDSGELHLTREGGHSARRVVHAADATGHAIQKQLTAAVEQHPNIDIFTHHIAIDLITNKHPKLNSNEDCCYGVYALDSETQNVDIFSANNTVLSTGGAGKVYLYTTNPDSTSGDGIAMAYRAGCQITNMEFMQFHPTCLFHPLEKSFLITEAVRGEGGYLRLPDKQGQGSIDGHRFMLDHDERAELAPRDIVARAIDYEMKKGGYDCVYLDITHRPKEFILEHFPTIYAKCLSLGIDIATSPIPVVPAAHYTCGGVATDTDAKTNIKNLLAIGETTYTGLHGANRLASNSLVECIVFGKAAAKTILSSTATAHPTLPAWDESQVSDPDEQVIISHNWDELRRFMWNYVGIVRTDKRLARAANRIALLHEEIDDFYANFKVNPDLIELRNLAQVADLIVQSAQQRKESRGLHFTKDYPDLVDSEKKVTILQKS
jgi:L-aspartate oxidase